MKHLISGNIRISTKGAGYLSLDPNAGRDGEAVEIDPTLLNTALPGDLVEVEIDPGIEGERRTGRVNKILERKRLEFVGLLEKDGDFYFVIPDDKRVYKDILIADKKIDGAQPGDKVLAKIITWTDPKKDPVGEVTKAIGQAGRHETEMQAIIYERGFVTGFPLEIEAEAKAIKSNATTDLTKEIELVKSGATGARRDFRDVLTFTIDPADAKDFDDAISYRELSDGKIEVGVHIADPAHYVKPGTKLDQEAIKRATSIYLVDRTIPMLPEVLSNDLCSLNPGADKLTFSAVFTFDPDFKLLDEWYGRTIIHSNKRFTYEDAQASLDQPAGEYHQELSTLNALAKQLRAAREQNGSISFDSDEIKFVLDQNGKPLKVIRKERTDSHLLIEDLMLLANRKVAEFVSKIVKNADKHFVYRVHDVPDIERIKQLADFVKPLGYELKIEDGQVTQNSINKLLAAVEDKPEEAMVHTAAMRTMSKAIYSTKNIGHYGLAFQHYAHFTSPIRRYPDIMVHRLLDYYLRHAEPSAQMLEEYHRLADHATEREIAAAEAERDSIRYKQVEYMGERIGQIYAGVISGLAKWGIFVQEKETLAEGLVRLVDLKDDFYIFDEKNYSMIGKSTGRRYRLGDPVRVKVVKADLKEKQIDFEFV